MASESGPADLPKQPPDPAAPTEETLPADRAPDITPGIPPLAYVPPQPTLRYALPPVEETEPVRVRVEGYEVARVLGRGGMGIVYEAPAGPRPHRRPQDDPARRPCRPGGPRPLPHRRAKALKNLGAIQEALDHHRAVDPRTTKPAGAWNLFRDQTNPTGGSVYVTTIVCQALPDLREAGVGWRGSAAERDELLSACVGWLADRFDGRGWKTPGGTVEALNDGLTLHVFALLLRAEEAGVTTLPEVIVRAIPRHLEGCASRDMNYPVATSIDSSHFRARGGAVQRPHRTVRHLWHPWAIACAAHWVRRVERTAAAIEQGVSARRVLGHLLIGLGDDYRKEARSTYAFVGADSWGRRRCLRLRRWGSETGASPTARSPADREVRRHDLTPAARG